MKYLRKFDSHEAYSAKYPEIKDQDYCVSAVEDTCGKKAGEAADIRVYFKDTNFAAWAGDLLCWDTEKNKWVTYQVDHSVDTALDLPANLVPDAVCVVPACHTEDGKARWCALNDVTNESLRYGSESSAVTGGDYFQWQNTEISPAVHLEECGGWLTTNPQMIYETNDDGSITFKNEIYYDTEDPEMNLHDSYEIPTILPDKYLKELVSPYYQTCLENMENQTVFPIEGYPSDAKCIADYYGDGSCDLRFRPMCYGPDLRSKNSVAFAYYQNTYSDSHCSFSEMDGQKNTQVLLHLSPTGKEYPAALASSLYSQEYSHVGTWYLPAVCELFYLWNHWYTIQHTLYRLSDKHVGDYSASPLDCYDCYWSSSQCSADRAVNLDTYYGGLYWGNKNGSILVRPFRSF